MYYELGNLSTIIRNAEPNNIIPLCEYKVMRSDITKCMKQISKPIESDTAFKVYLTSLKTLHDFLLTKYIDGVFGIDMYYALCKLSRYLKNYGMECVQ